MSEDKHDSKKPQRLKPQDFRLVCLLGKGSFGSVYQVEYKVTGQIYAMKVMMKKDIVMRDHSELIKEERNVMTQVNHPNIVTLRYSFQTNDRLFLVMDYISGGHLYFQLFKQGQFSDTLGRFFASEIVLALAHLHSLNIIHRDIKPENILLDADGHIKLTDFGLAKSGIDHDGRSNTKVGTIDYMAPEVITGTGHGKEADWWSVGVIICEMLQGDLPFRAPLSATPPKRKKKPVKGKAPPKGVANASPSDTDASSEDNLLYIQTEKRIISGQPRIAKSVSGDARKLIKALLEKKPSNRLGTGPHGSADIMAHPFFKGVNWDRLGKKLTKPPFQPSMAHSGSVENFETMFTQQNLPGSTAAAAVWTPDESVDGEDNNKKKGQQKQNRSPQIKIESSAAQREQRPAVMGILPAHGRFKQCQGMFDNNSTDQGASSDTVDLSSRLSHIIDQQGSCFTNVGQCDIADYVTLMAHGLVAGYGVPACTWPTSAGQEPSSSGDQQRVVPRERADARGDGGAEQAMPVGIQPGVYAEGGTSECTLASPCTECVCQYTRHVSRCHQLAQSLYRTRQTMNWRTCMEVCSPHAISVLGADWASTALLVRADESIKLKSTWNMLNAAHFNQQQWESGTLKSPQVSCQYGGIFEGFSYTHSSVFRAAGSYVSSALEGTRGTDLAGFNMSGGECGLGT